MPLPTSLLKYGAMRGKVQAYFVNNPLWQSLFQLKGNTRVAVFLQPLWAVAFTLYAPYLPVYMRAMGLSDFEIGAVTAAGLFVQFVAAFFGGIVSEHLGRRRAVLIFDLLCWSLPMVLYFLADNYALFLAASLLSGLCQISNGSWSSLLMEDADRSQLVYVFTWIQIAGYIAVFFAPLAAWLVGQQGLVWGTRILLLFAAVSMTAKCLLFFFLAHDESGPAKVRFLGPGSLAQLKKFGPTVKHMWSRKSIRFIWVVMVLYQSALTFSGTYFGIYITENLGVSPVFLSYFPMIRALMSFLLTFLVQTRLNRLPFKIPFGVGLGLYLLGQVLLLVAPFTPASLILPLLIFYTLTEALGAALVLPQRDAFLNNALDDSNRIWELSMVNAMVVLVAALSSLVGARLVQEFRQGAFILALVAHTISLLATLFYPISDKEEANINPAL